MILKMTAGLSDNQYNTMKKFAIAYLLIILTAGGCVQNKKKVLGDFGIRATNLFFYYEDLDEAVNFYSEILGMVIVADYETSCILRVAKDSYLVLVDATKGMHSADEPKTVALALLSDQLDEWYSYLKTKDIEFKYDYNPKEGSAHDGFVIIDPEGYLLEFERFNPHVENKDFIPILEDNIAASVESSFSDPLTSGLQIHSTICWLYYDDILPIQEFYTENLGFPMLADQGWAKIHKVSETGFIGFVDGSRGMHKPTASKAVNVGFIVDDLQGWMDYVKNINLFELRDQELTSGPEGRYKAFVGYDPGGYYLEFDSFYPHPDNDILINFLRAE
jgi:catechol 2,3-dioxygenase-like lactoylglutathione lyase family enzyme